MQFQVRTFDTVSATVHEEVVEADSRAALEERFQGAVLLSARALDGARGRVRLFRLDASAQPALDVAWWCRELRTLLTAGMTVVEALETLNAQSMSQVQGKVRVHVNTGLVMQLRQGRALSDAMRLVGGFPSVLVAGVSASERTSSLVEALDDYLRYHEMLERLRKQVVSAAIYPSVVVTLGGGITVFLLLFVIPRFSRMYSDLHGPVSWTTRMLVGVSHVLNVHGSLVVAALGIVGTGLVLGWRRGLIQRLAMQVAQGIGPLQVRIDEFRLAKLYHSLALMFRGGYALDDALRQCMGLGLGERIQAGVERAQWALARGQRVSAAFGESGLTDTVSQRLLAVGERTGNFDRVLQTIAERHAANFTTFVERATRVIEPVLLMLVALVVGGIVVMMYMPVFDIASSVR